MAEKQWDKYTLLRCRCGGIIGDRSGRRDIDMIRCDRYRKVYPIYKLDFDVIMTNPRTGWIFPVKYRRI